MTSSIPLTGAQVNYVTAHNTDNSLRRAIVVGHAEWSDEELHLAVLDDDGANLDLLSLAVPQDPTGVSVGSWHQPPAAAWPSEEGEVDTEAAEAG